MPRSDDAWRCAECGLGGRRRANATVHYICLQSALFREDVLQLVERFPLVPITRVAADLGVAVADVERFCELARARRRRLNAEAQVNRP